MAGYDYKDVSSAATGIWDAILPALGVELRKLDKNGPCVLCGGNDRAHFFERQGRIMNYCRHGCGNSGPGNEVSTPEHLLMEVNGWKFPEMVQAVAQFLNVTPREKLDHYRVIAATRVQKQLVPPSDHREDPAKAADILSRCESTEKHMYLLANNAAAFTSCLTLKGSLIVELRNLAGDIVNLAAIAAAGDIRYAAGGMSYGAVAVLEPAHDNDGATILCISYADAWRLWWIMKGKTRIICAMEYENAKWIADKQRERFTHVGCLASEQDYFEDYGHEVILIPELYAGKVA